MIVYPVSYDVFLEYVWILLHIVEIKTYFSLGSELEVDERSYILSFEFEH